MVQPRFPEPNLQQVVSQQAVSLQVDIVVGLFLSTEYLHSDVQEEKGRRETTTTEKNVHAPFNSK